MATWTDPPENYVFWSWVNEEGQGPEEEWDNRAEALEDLNEARSVMPGVGRWLYKGAWEGDEYQEEETEYLE